MTKREISILESVLQELHEKELECFRQMAYMKEHKFEMERSAINYKLEAYNNSWLILSSAIDKLKKK